MRSWSKVAAVGVLLAAGLGCYQPMQEVTSGPDVDAIRAVSAAEIAALVAEDMDAHLATLTEDCIMLPPNEPAVVGHEAIAEWHGGFIEMFDIAGGYTGAAGGRLVEDRAGHLELGCSHGVRTGLERGQRREDGAPRGAPLCSRCCGGTAAAATLRC